jgi:diacylglycerol O-acyltransferase / trehalose O-mycolyltransferase
MKWSSYLVVAAMSVLGAVRANAAAVVVGSHQSGRVLDLQIASDALNKTVSTRLLLPRDWDAQPNARWPVLYLLHGAKFDKSDSTPNSTLWSTQTDLVDFTANSNILIVMPEGGNDGWYSDWYNDGAGGAPGWETFHLVELRNILEQQFRAANVRAIAGVSMGGFGALSYAARHPGMFGAAASYSGDLDTLGAWFLTSLPSFFNGDNMDLVWGNVFLSGSRWSAHNPTALVGALGQLPIFVSSGNGTPGPLDAAGAGGDLLEPAVALTSLTFVGALAPLNPMLTTDFYGKGTHTWPYWEREFHRSFPMLARALGR